MTKQEQIAAFLDAHIGWPRAVRWAAEDYSWLYGYTYWQPSGPTAEELASELLDMAEFRALQLGTWLGTTDGQIIAQAVEMVAPPFYREDIELLVAALQNAGQRQYQEGQHAAGRFALGATVVAGVIAVGIAMSGRAA
jgi:hypothetical protein